jgi:hypothetical protein
VVIMTGWSNGNSFGESAGSSLGASVGNAVGSGTLRWPVPTWKFGLRQSDDRGSI